MIKNINMCECATYDKDGASISDCKRLILFMEQTVAEKRQLAIIFNLELKINIIGVLLIGVMLRVKI